MFRNDQCEYPNWTSLEFTYIKTMWYSWYRGTVLITESTRLFFMDFDMQRTWEICGWVTFLRYWNSHPSTSLLKPKNDPEHVVMAPEIPSTGRRVHGRQDSKRDERDSYPARDRRYGAYRNDSVSMVPLSMVNLCTRETGTRMCTKKEVPMQDRKGITIPAVRSK